MINSEAHGCMALVSLDKKFGKYCVVMWDRKANKTKLKINYNKPVQAAYFTDNDFVVVQDNLINVYETVKYGMMVKLDRQNIVFSYMIKLKGTHTLIYSVAGEGELRELKIDALLSYPEKKKELLSYPVKLAAMDSRQRYLLVSSEGDKEMAMVDTKKEYEEVFKFQFADGDSLYDDLMKFPFRALFVLTKDVIVVMNEDNMYRLIDLSKEKPSPWHVAELQKHLKFDFKLGSPSEDLPTSSRQPVNPAIKTTLTFNYGQVEKFSLVS